VYRKNTKIMRVCFFALPAPIFLQVTLSRVLIKEREKRKGPKKREKEKACPKNFSHQKSYLIEPFYFTWTLDAVATGRYKRKNPDQVYPIEVSLCLPLPPERTSDRGLILFDLFPRR